MGEKMFLSKNPTFNKTHGLSKVEQQSMPANLLIRERVSVRPPRRRSAFRRQIKPARAAPRGSRLERTKGDSTFRRGCRYAGCGGIARPRQGMRRKLSEGGIECQFRVQTRKFLWHTSFAGRNAHRKVVPKFQDIKLCS